MRLIDADALRADYIVGFSVAGSLFVGVVDKQPTIDAAPIAHAEWKESSEHDKMYCKSSAICSICEQYVTFPTNYCPYCGAKMDA